MDLPVIHSLGMTSVPVDGMADSCGGKTNKARVELVPALALGLRTRFSTRFAVAPLVLASSSQIRRAMLAAAGVEFETAAPGVNESALKAGYQDARQIAPALAAAKCVAVSNGRPEAWVIGSDSIVECDGRPFDKPRSREEAADHLHFFSGRLMQLTSAVALARGGALDWSHAETAALHVRVLSEQFIETYLDAEWPEVGYCVGVFRLEGLGVQLFERIDGDHFTVLGMPLLPLLGALRARSVLPA